MIPYRHSSTLTLIVLSILLLGYPGPQLQAQLDPTPKPTSAGSVLSDPSMSSGKAFLFQLEAKFAQDTAAGGGKAFGSYFAGDAVALSNGRAPVIGHDAIASGATWSPADYQLTWVPKGGQMSASGDMGFTWGHYEGRSKDKAGQPVIEKGRYMTVWKKQADGSWKVVLDSSSNEPPDAAECCKVP